MQNESDGPARAKRTTTNMVVSKRLAIYLRTSTLNGKGQDSLAEQESKCREWASGADFEVVAVFQDEAVSGTLGIASRPGLRAALEALEDGIAEGIVVHRVDRLARELHVQELVLAHAWALGDDIEVFESGDGAIRRDSASDPQRKLLRQIVGAVSEFERSMITTRLQGGRRRKARRGGYVGGTRLHRQYGYELAGGAYTPVEGEQGVISRIVALRGEGTTWAAIAEILTTDDVPPPSSATWHATTVRRIGQRELERVHA